MRIFRGKAKGMVHTMNIELGHIRAVFFPRTFHEKYRYLGSVPWHEKGDIFEAMEPLVIYMDSKAKPWWCPRWVLRFLHLFGNDNSIVRVRNFTLHKWSRNLTKGIMIWDYKTKWHHYDLRISIAGTKEMNWLSDAIESKFYRDGRKEELISILKKAKPDEKWEWKSLRDLEDAYRELED